MYAVASPYPQYFDNDGSPLDSGYVFFGVAGQNPITSPVSVYWDIDGTIPAAQPIRTLNGFLSRNGTPAQIYSSAPCDVIVKNKRGLLVGNGSKSTLVPSSATSFIPIATSSGIRTVQDKLREIVSLDDFYVVGTTVSGQIQRAIDSGISPIKVRSTEWLVSSTIFINNKKVSFITEGGDGGTTNKYAKFKLSNGANCNMFEFVGDNAYLSLTRIDLDGNKANQSTTSSSGIYMPSASTYSVCFSMRNSFIRNFKGRGIDAGANRNSGRIYDGSLIELNDSEGLYLFNNVDWRVSESEIGQNGIGNATENCFLDGYTSSVDFINVDFYYAGKSGLLIGPGVQICTVIGGQINSNQQHGIWVQHGGSYPSANRTIIISDVVFAANSQLAHNTYSDIFNEAPRIAVHGCGWHKYPGATIYSKYGIFNGSTSYVIGGGNSYDLTWFGTSFTNQTNQVLSVVREIILGAGGFQRFTNQTGTVNIIESYNSGESYPRVRIRNTGVLSFGDGTAEPDASWLRPAEKVMGVLADNSIRSGLNVTSNRPNAVNVGAASMFYDTTLKKPIWSDGAVWRDASGTAV